LNPPCSSSGLQSEGWLRQQSVYITIKVCCALLCAVRRLVQNIKKKFPVVLGRINQLIGRLQVLGPDASIDVDQAALRVTLDVIGLVSSLSCAVLQLQMFWVSQTALGL
jgi:hypothetical protein